METLLEGQGKKLGEATLEEMDAAWERVKRAS
jgi:uncharacterized protein YabN with tetrapyrrole methylase and pyrophosphatase domain